MNAVGYAGCGILILGTTFGLGTAVGLAWRLEPLDPLPPDGIIQPALPGIALELTLTFAVTWGIKSLGTGSGHAPPAAETLEVQS